ncbi:LysR family transcriptional regulator [Novosphingobium sp. ST904]|uniref:LysR family transcriptional regulator n=1 Tax=Novosphingobium sp. ST904 TaxID=1684385 RepID=UPI0006C8A475|nr:LysR family transcriptional regulator [Novosphingobium sp. ST904]KPH64074.1 LysR family transcriptional regulator [Novosphingobium sp. ST904]TCM32432.1 DNA-binding transcriptional LysR family regulator [Novosphingobium sp. ST904]
MPHLPDFEAWAVFAKVAEKGSFRQAAEELGLAKATVSKTITRLETRMRTTLIHRTTRKLSLTESGRLSLERALRILADGEAVEAAILEEAAVPRGLVRLAATTGFGAKALAPHLPAFLQAYPEIDLELYLTEDRIDIVADGFDAAVQIGAGEDSSLRMSRLFSYSLPLIAAPSLLDRLGVPAHPDELPRYPAIIPTHIPWGNDWEFQRGTEKVSLQVQGKFRANHPAAMVPAALAGLGLGLIPEYFVSEHLADGTLVEVLSEWNVAPGPVYLVTPPGRARPARVRALLDFLKTQFAAQPWARGIEQ